LSKAVDARFIAIERELLEAEPAIALIDRCRPLNTRTEIERLVEGWEAGEPATPSWRYRQAPRLVETRRALEHVVKAAEGQGFLGEQYAERARELDKEAAIAEAIGSPDVEAFAALRFPLDRTAAGLAADVCAREWAALAPQRGEPQVLAEDERDPRSLVSAVGTLIGALRLPTRVVLVPDLASAAAASDGVILIRPSVLHTESAARRVALHEVVGHALPRILARAEPLALFRVGSASGADDEEGRALLLEERHGLLGDARRRELGVRHLGASAVRRGADWVELVRLILQHGMTARDAIRLAARIARGGGLARELVYLPALFRVRSALSKEPELEGYLARGRIGVAAAGSLHALGVVIESRDDRDVIGRFVLAPRRDVELRAGANVGERPGREDQIDPKPVIANEARSAVVPPGK
jgi:hypothetical protein